MSCELIMTVEEMQDRKAWLQMRRTGIGGSDAAVIVGQSKWKSPWDLWLDKTGQAEIEEDESDEKRQDRLFFGSESEEMISKWFTNKTGKKLRRCGMIRSIENPFMLADVDRLVVGENAIVEIKTTSAYNSSEWENDKVPPAYLIQGLHYMATGSYDKCYFVCLIGGQEPVIRTLTRDEEVEEQIEALVEAEKYFWEHNVIAKELPDVDGSKACAQAISKHFNGDGTEAVDLEGEYDLLCKDLEILKEERKKLDLAIATKENKLKVALGNGQFGRTAKYNVFFKTTNRTTFNSKQFEKDYPDLYNKYLNNTSYRSLRIHESKARMND